MKMTEQYPQRLCCHEAGHAVVAFSLGVRVVAVSVFFTEKEGWKGTQKPKVQITCLGRIRLCFASPGRLPRSSLNAPKTYGHRFAILGR
jgi:hypothetical protein